MIISAGSAQVSKDNSSADAAARLSLLIEGYWSTQTINAAVQLGVPDLLGAGAVDVAAMARASGAHAPSLARLMRGLVTLGICEAEGEAGYRLTGLGRLLRSDAEGSMRGRALFAGGMLSRQFSDLVSVVKTGQRQPSAPPDFETLDAASLAVFQQAMAESSLKAARDAVDVYDFSQFRRVLDVGGGFGGVLAFLLQRFPDLCGDVFDLQMVGEGARSFLTAEGLGTRAGFIGGDFFKSVPDGYDCYQLKYILHDWNDERALTILKSCRAAMSPDARLVVLEQIVPDVLKDDMAHRAVIRGDLTMLTVGGKERTAEEYRILLAEAGLRLTAIRPTRSTFGVIEAVPE